jgi:hypothetical protein
VPEAPEPQVESRVIEGRIAPGAPDWVYVPIEVPEGVSELAVSYSYDRPEPPAGQHGNALDAGIFDSEGFRGWSGGARDSFFINAAEATPGYVPGPIGAGTWQLLLGPYTVHPDGMAYRVEVTLRTDARAARAFEPSHAPLQANGRGRAWYRGDLHTHTVHSDGQWQPQELLDAARAAGLDFIVSTEHNTNTAHGIWGRHTADDLLIINGEEVTTRNGHLVAAGLAAGTWLDWRHRAVDGTLPGVLAEIHQQDGLAIAAHPHAPCLGCQWKHGYAGIDAVEVWNGEWTVDDEVSLQGWNTTLVESGRVRTWLPAVGASDTHESSSPIGLAQTVVLADDLTVPAILAGIRAGRCYVTDSSEVSVELAATGGGVSAGIGERLAVTADTEVAIEVTVRGVADGYVRLVTDEGWVAHLPIPAKGESVTWRTTPTVSSYVRAEIRHNRETPFPLLEPMAALTNPVFLGR